MEAASEKGGQVDSRTRSGMLAVLFERLVEGQDSRTVAIAAQTMRFTLKRHGNVVSCVCELRDPTPEQRDALRRHGAVDDTFMISPKLPGREFGQWLDRLLVEDLGCDPTVELQVMDLQPAA